MKYFILTMQYNEDLMLPIFLDHYSRFLDPKDIKVIDHGSTTINDQVLKNYDRIYIPRNGPFSEVPRLKMIQNIVSGLLEYYDFGIYVDCDELIDLTNINQIDFTKQQVHYVAGFEAFLKETHNGTRLHGLVSPGMCKPSIFSRMPHWTVGFHTCDVLMDDMLTFPMIHARFLDGTRSKDRLESRIKVFDSFADYDKDCNLGIHWSQGEANFDSFYSYIATKDCTDIRVFDSIDPNIFKNSDHHTYLFSDTEYDLTDRFPHIVNKRI